MYRIVGVTSNKRYVVPLTKLQPPNIADRAAISFVELHEMHQRMEEHQMKTDNSEMLGTAGVRLEEELRQLELEGQKLCEQLLQTERLLECAENQHHSCRRKVEIWKQDLEEVVNVAERQQNVSLCWMNGSV